MAQQYFEVRWTTICLAYSVDDILEQARYKSRCLLRWCICRTNGEIKLNSGLLTDGCRAIGGPVDAISRASLKLRGKKSAKALWASGRLIITHGY
jgi:hypothetical protein